MAEQIEAVTDTERGSSSVGCDTPDTGSVLDLIEAINSGRFDPTTLDATMRRRCVVQLTGEGLHNEEVARLMRISERTVQRDRQAERRRRALAPDRQLGDELMGEFERYTLASIGRLTRMSRDPKTPPYARLWAEEAIGRMYQRFVDTARRLNYLEQGADRLRYQREGDLDLHRENVERQALLLKAAGLDGDELTKNARKALNREARKRQRESGSDPA